MEAISLVLRMMFDVFPAMEGSGRALRRPVRQAGLSRKLK